MGVEYRRLSTLMALILLLFPTAVTHGHYDSLRTRSLLTNSGLTQHAVDDGSVLKKRDEEEGKPGNGSGELTRFLDRKRLGGPGSSPPTCRSKCGWCNPCKPVHVAIQPGLSMPLEYYPEAWRCKCGNKFFMP